MLFRHGDVKSADSSPPAKGANPAPPAVAATQPPAPIKDTSPEALRELLEKNLKWSQIIYEQNRRINGKLFWTAFANWVRLFILIASLALAAWFLPPIISGMIQKYNQIISDPSALLNGSAVGQNSNVSTGDLCNLLPANMQDNCRSITTKK